MIITKITTDLTERYIDAWSKFSKRVPWSKENIFLYYNNEEEKREIEHELIKGRGLFLALQDDSGKIEGVLGIKIRGTSAYLRPWEPMLSERISYTFGHKLIESALNILKEQGVKQLVATLKYRPDEHPQILIYLKYYRSAQQRTESVQLLCHLRGHTFKKRRQGRIRIVEGTEYSIETFTDVALKAFASTKEDRRIHGSDVFTQNRGESLKIHERIKKGAFGESPPECWKIALLNGEIAGAAICFIRESEYHPRHGVIAELGVIPKFRRQKVGTELMRSIHKTFQNHQCDYGYVGTPAENTPAIEFYRHFGYNIVFRLMHHKWNLS